MGLFNWLWRRRESRSNIDLLGAFGPQARAHHYLFAHKVLPSYLWSGESFLGILANPENQEFIVSIWNDLGQDLDRQDRLPSDGLRHSSHWIGNEHLVILIELPPAKICPEAQFIAVTTSPQIRYLTLEKSFSVNGESDSFVLAEWTIDGIHGNYGEAGEPTANSFLKAVCRHMSLAETVEPPTRQQLQGMRRGGATMYMEKPMGLPEEDMQKVEGWEKEAKAALEADDLPCAEQLYRQVLDLRMSQQGPDNTNATLAHADLVRVLNQQGRHPEAEALCRTWWRYCRRYRMLAHAESMLATRTLAECLRAQGRYPEVAELMSYRAQLSGLARGGNSMEANHARSDLAFYQKILQGPAEALSRPVNGNENEGPRASEP